MGAHADTLLDAVLTPHRSLSAAGFWLLMAAVAGVSFTAGLAFALKGAWPVCGFLGLDVALVYLALRASYRGAALRETVRLTRDLLEITRVLPSGDTRRWTFQPYWLRVSLEAPPGTDARLVVGSHGRSLEIGAFLPPDERRHFAEALRAALGRVREPAFG